MVGEMAGGRGYLFRQEKDWIGRFEEDLKAFGIRPNGWRDEVQKAGR